MTWSTGDTVQHQHSVARICPICSCLRLQVVIFVLRVVCVSFPRDKRFFVTGFVTGGRPMAAQSVTQSCHEVTQIQEKQQGRGISLASARPPLSRVLLKSDEGLFTLQNGVKNQTVSSCTADTSPSGRASGAAGCGSLSLSRKAS